MQTANPDERGFLEALVGDGRPLVTLTGLALVFSGGFACWARHSDWSEPV